VVGKGGIMAVASEVITYNKSYSGSQRIDIKKNSDLAYCVKGGGSVHDWRKTNEGKKHGLNVTGIFGTSNNLFEGSALDNSALTMLQKGNLRDLTDGESCQFSSAFWCRKALFREYDCNVHEKHQREIGELFLKNGRYGFLTKKPHELKKVANNAGLVASGSIILQRPKDLVLDILWRGAPDTTLLIEMFTHVIAGHRSVNAVYIFDNTAGCLKFQTRNAMKDWLKWICGKNDERGIAVTRAAKLYNLEGYEAKDLDKDGFMKWTAINCKLKRN
jgi:hypothetical protein